MVGPTKILTVSYGAFSCTLEGFDEPFTTMKAIAEYFRDLAAHDRYFGAEPPTPDTEMLHRIAEREIQRKVEARIDDQGIVLRQSPEGASSKRPADRPAATSVPFTGPADDQSVAAKLLRIRAAVAEAARTQDAPAPVTSAFGGAEGDEGDIVLPAADAPMAEDEDFGFDVDIGDIPSGARSPVAESVEAEEVVPDADTAEPIVDLDTLMADADPVEAVDDQRGEVEDRIVAWNDEPEAAGIDEPADEPQATAYAATDPAEMWAAPDETFAPVETPVEEEPSPELTAEADEDVFGTAHAEDAAVEDGEGFDLDAEADDALRAMFADPRDDDAAPAVLPAEPQDFDDAARATADAVSGDDRLPEDEPEPTVEDAPSLAAAEADLPESGDEASANFFQRARARVIKVRRDAAEDLRAMSRNVAEPRAPERELSEEEVSDHVARANREATPPRDPGRAILEESAATSSDAVDRLMGEANEKLEGAESRRRISAIAHLKAAVAATVADRKLKVRDVMGQHPSEAEDEIDRYRDDLSRAVRPRRPDTDPSLTASARPEPARMAPLVLVSAQRVDDTGLAGPNVIRPRRVSSGDAVPEEGDDFEEDADDVVISPEEARSFAEFAERVGATNLPELLEAAAAYTAAVEGRPHFSRPHILNKVAHVAEDDRFNREDGLRSFGMLLRQGKIQKVRRGQFVITDSSRYLNEVRRAAQ